MSSPTIARRRSASRRCCPSSRPRHRPRHPRGAVVAASEGIALARVDGAKWLAVTDLASGELTVLELPRGPDRPRRRADRQVRGRDPARARGSSFLELPLPLVNGDEYTQHEVAGEYVGQSAMAQSGETMLLFTTVNPFMLDRRAAGQGFRRRRRCRCSPRPAARAPARPPAAAPGPTRRPVRPGHDLGRQHE